MHFDRKHCNSLAALAAFHCQISLLECSLKRNETDASLQCRLTFEASLFMLVPGVMPTGMTPCYSIPFRPLWGLQSVPPQHHFWRQMPNASSTACQKTHNCRTIEKLTREKLHEKNSLDEKASGNGAASPLDDDEFEKELEEDPDFADEQVA